MSELMPAMLSLTFLLVRLSCLRRYMTNATIKGIVAIKRSASFRLIDAIAMKEPMKVTSDMNRSSGP